MQERSVEDMMGLGWWEISIRMWWPEERGLSAVSRQLGGIWQLRGDTVSVRGVSGPGGGG